MTGLSHLSELCQAFVLSNSSNLVHGQSQIKVTITTSAKIKSRSQAWTTSRFAHSRSTVPKDNASYPARYHCYLVPTVQTYVLRSPSENFKYTSFSLHDCTSTLEHGSLSILYHQRENLDTFNCERRRCRYCTEKDIRSRSVFRLPQDYVNDRQKIHVSSRAVAHSSEKRRVARKKRARGSGILFQVYCARHFCCGAPICL